MVHLHRKPDLNAFKEVVDVLVPVLVSVGAVVVVPLALQHLATPGVDRVARAWPLVGVLAALGLLLPRGPVAALSAVPYLVAGLLAAGLGLRRLLVRGPGLAEVAPLTVVGGLVVAGSSLVAERAGYPLLGFSSGWLLLTVAHFQVAVCAAAVLAGLVARAVPGPLAQAGVLGVPVGSAVVAVGHLTTHAVELVGTLVLTAALGATTWLAGRHLRPRLAPRPRALLTVAVAVLPVTLLLACWFALGRQTGLPHPDVALMAQTHGVLNTLGVGVCGLLALRPVVLHADGLAVRRHTRGRGASGRTGTRPASAPGAQTADVGSLPR